jgi:hypothetical protein
VAAGHHQHVTRTERVDREERDRAIVLPYELAGQLARDAMPLTRQAVPRYPFTLTLENDNIARPVVGRPMESAGRKVVKVVKISMFFLTCGSNEASSLEPERMR